MNDLSHDIKAYETMQKDLELHHDGKWVVICEGDFVDAFDTLDAAASEAINRFGRGPYLIRRVGAPPLTLPASVMIREPHATN